MKVAANALCAGLLASCVTLPPSHKPSSSIKIARGPCFGFCPVYTLNIDSDGRATFDGQRHTATLGIKARQISPASYFELSRKLAPYRPTTNATLPCERLRTDSAKYTVTWRQGGAPVELTVDTGCGDKRAADFVRILDGAAGSAGFDKDSAQVTRPGVTRG